MKKVENILLKFAFPDSLIRIEKNTKDGLSQIYFVNNTHTLRWRTLWMRTCEDFLTEKKLLDEIRWLLSPIHFPELIQAKTWEYYVIKEDVFWTLATYIPWKILCWISDVSVLSERNKKTYIEQLYDMQLRTSTIKQQGKSHYIFAPWIYERYKIIQDYFTFEEQGCIKKIIEEISAISGEDEMCFVHGDYHPGNIVLSNDEHLIEGLIDLDWCHVGTIYEDLSLIILSYLRDISHECFVYDEEKLKHLIGFYPRKVNFQKIQKYILLRAVNDLSFLLPRKGWWFDKINLILTELVKEFLANIST